MQKLKKIDEMALVLAVAVLAIVVAFYNQGKSDIAGDAERISDMVSDGNKVSFANNGIIDEGKMIEVQNMDYDEFKKSLNVRNDFCIYVEDEEGNIILAKGSSKLNSFSTYCRE